MSKGRQKKDKIKIRYKKEENSQVKCKHKYWMKAKLRNKSENVSQWIWDTNQYKVFRFQPLNETEKDYPKDE